MSNKQRQRKINKGVKTSAMIDKQRQWKINKGVRPYGGKTFPGYLHTHPNGRKVVILYVSSAAAHKSLGVGGDPREYDLNEVTEVTTKPTKEEIMELQHFTEDALIVMKQTDRFAQKLEVFLDAHGERLSAYTYAKLEEALFSANGLSMAIEEIVKLRRKLS